MYPHRSWMMVASVVFFAGVTALGANGGKAPSLVDRGYDGAEEKGLGRGTGSVQ